MKIRKGFVSNSSSSSFIIPLYRLTPEQKVMLYNHIEIAMEVDAEMIRNGGEPIYEYYEEWNIQEDDFSMWCSTSMDNFDLYGFIERELKLNAKELIEMEDDGYWLDYSIFDTSEYKMLVRRMKLDKLTGNA